MSKASIPCRFAEDHGTGSQCTHQYRTPQHCIHRPATCKDPSHQKPSLKVIFLRPLPRMSCCSFLRSSSSFFLLQAWAHMAGARDTDFQDHGGSVTQPTSTKRSMARTACWTSRHLPGHSEHNAPCRVGSARTRSGPPLPHRSSSSFLACCLRCSSRKCSSSLRASSSCRRRAASASCAQGTIEAHRRKATAHRTECEPCIP